MTNDDALEQLWRIEVEASISKRYHQFFHSRHSWCDRFVRITVGFLSVFGLVFTLSPSIENKWIPISVAVLGVFAAIVLNIVPFGEWSRNSEDFARRWTQLSADAEAWGSLLRSERNDGNAHKYVENAVQRMIQKQNELEGSEPSPDRKRLEQCQAEEHQYRGLPSPENQAAVA